MAFLIKPNYIIIYDHKKRYVYYCPKCKVQLTNRISRGKLVKMFVPWAPLKRYRCEECSNKYLVYKGKTFVRSVKIKQPYKLQTVQAIADKTC